MDTILIGIAGGTGSGKTTLADKLVESFGRDEVSILRHDNYYKRHDDIPFEERAKLNYDHPDAFDTDLLCQHILELKAGKSIEMPVYDYATIMPCITARIKRFWSILPRLSCSRAFSSSLRRISAI